MFVCRFQPRYLVFDHQMDEECTWKEAEQDEIGTETEKGSTLTELTVAVELQSSQTKVKMPQAAKIKLPSIDES